MILVVAPYVLRFTSKLNHIFNPTDAAIAKAFNLEYHPATSEAACAAAVSRALSIQHHTPTEASIDPVGPPTAPGQLATP